MIIGYEGYAQGNDGIADRRRVLFWAKERGHLIVDSRDPKADLIVITSSADLGYWDKAKTSIPIILDVVDGLIGEQSTTRDFLRGFSYWGTRKSSNLLPKSYQNMILTVAKKCNAVVCSSPEQVREWSKFNIKAVDILDIHEEIPLSNRAHTDQKSETNEIFWEGLPATLGSMYLLQDFFVANEDSKYKLNILTNLSSFQYMNKYKRINLDKLMSKQLSQKNLAINLVQWTPQDLVNFSRESTFGVIPIVGLKGYNHLKAENRLLIMWRLGLPVLASPLASYSRVMKEAGIDGICKDSGDWRIKLEKLQGSIEMREEFIQKSHAYLENRHNYMEILEKWDSVLGKV